MGGVVLRGVIVLGRALLKPNVWGRIFGRGAAVATKIPPPPAGAVGGTAAATAVVGAAKMVGSQQAGTSSTTSSSATNVAVRGSGNGKCGDSGKYKDLDRANGTLDADHIPSKAALLARATSLNGSMLLNAAQESAIVNNAYAINIPSSAHQQFSPSYGGRNTWNQVKSDSNDLQGAAQRDTDAMEKNIDKVDPECKEKYKQAADKARSMTNQDYDNWLQQMIDQNKGPS